MKLGLGSVLEETPNVSMLTRYAKMVKTWM